MTNILSEFAYLHGNPDAKATLKAKPEHFIVKENLAVEFSGVGEHLMVKVRKTGENTSFVANELAKFCDVKSKDVGWAGRKDRHAITEQWLSIHLPKTDINDFSAFEQQYPDIQVIDTMRHSRKLRPGDVAENDFEITLSEVSDVAEVERRINKVLQFGVPNYFGVQRFGRSGNNLKEARRWGKNNVRTKNQNQRSLYLSAARSWIFNRIVSSRIEQQLISTLLSGDIVTQSGQCQEVNDHNLAERQSQLESGNVALTAALAGDNALPTQRKALELEQSIVDSEPDLMALIRGNRMQHDRREVILKPKGLRYQRQGNDITLCFSLPSGCFATSVVRELVEDVIPTAITPLSEG